MWILSSFLDCRKQRPEGVVMIDVVSNYTKIFFQNGTRFKLAKLEVFGSCEWNSPAKLKG